MAPGCRQVVSIDLSSKHSALYIRPGASSDEKKGR